jgi:hypothetical protein
MCGIVVLIDCKNRFENDESFELLNIESSYRTWWICKNNQKNRKKS